MSPSVMAILGTRPEVVKLAPVILALQADATLDALVCATAQHRDMLDLALDVFGIVPDVDLDLMRPDQQIHEVMARVLEGVTRTLRETRPNFILVQGDTTTAMAATMSAFYEGIPVGHVEAGLRTGNMANPFPEEMNRKVIGTLATLHFAPTQRARAALLREGVRDEVIFTTGNTVIDALALAHPPAEERPPAQRQILVTAHRRESFGGPMEQICLGLQLLASRNPDVEIVFPVHPNPQVRAPVSRYLGNVSNVRLVEPLGYAEFVQAMRDAYLILTDSGGVQEEAPSLDTPVLVMRETTERPEAIEAGAARLIGTGADQIVGECERLLTDATLYRRMASAENPFGDGKAAGRIVNAVKEWLQVHAGGLTAGQKSA